MQKEHELGPEFYASQWFITLFCYDLPIELATRLLDLFLFDGYKVVHTTILALLASVQGTQPLFIRS